MLNHKIKLSLTNFKKKKLNDKLKALSDFNPSCSKHWKLINNIEKGPRVDYDLTTFSTGNIKISRQPGIS